MQKNDDVERRMKLREVYGDNELYGLVGQICNKYAGTRSTLRLMPLDFFEIIVGWLDMISAHLKGEALWKAGLHISEYDRNEYKVRSQPSASQILPMNRCRMRFSKPLPYFLPTVPS